MLGTSRTSPRGNLAGAACGGRSQLASPLPAAADSSGAAAIGVAATGTEAKGTSGGAEDPPEALSGLRCALRRLFAGDGLGAPVGAIGKRCSARRLSDVSGGPLCFLPSLDFFCVFVCHSFTPFCYRKSPWGLAGCALILPTANPSARPAAVMAIIFLIEHPALVGSRFLGCSEASIVPQRSGCLLSYPRMSSRVGGVMFIVILVLLVNGWC